MGGALGLAPDQLRAMSFYDFQAVAAGWRKANGVSGEGLTPAEEDALAAAIDRPLLWN
jgi:hypothetical protein